MRIAPISFSPPKILSRNDNESHRLQSASIQPQLQRDTVNFRGSTENSEQVQELITTIGKSESKIRENKEILTSAEDKLAAIYEEDREVAYKEFEERYNEALSEIKKVLSIGEDGFKKSKRVDFRLPRTPDLGLSPDTWGKIKLSGIADKEGKLNAIVFKENKDDKRVILYNTKENYVMAVVKLYDDDMAANKNCKIEGIRLYNKEGHIILARGFSTYSGDITINDPKTGRVLEEISKYGTNKLFYPGLKEKMIIKNSDSGRYWAYSTSGGKGWEINEDFYKKIQETKGKTFNYKHGKPNASLKGETNMLQNMMNNEYYENLFDKILYDEE